MTTGIIFGKTEAGRAEMAGRSYKLSALQRRVLILVDGQKTVNALGAFVRVGELDAVLDHLLHEGLIESTVISTSLQAPAAPGFSAAELTQAPRPATSPQEFVKVRQHASDFVREQLGAAGEPICAAIDRCDSPFELRKMLRGVEIFVGQRLSAETAQMFARHFGALLL
ncbi:MAG: hypothetical protein GZ093_13250 [Rhodoferax sp.]|uniref:hypothetical protein n=1 Tax=Rhodoferax sp. TaxID=50421 RepID=UPI0013FEC834|nr:hypothetical protein [Rhodoferax sp.]NDP39697.1 hypothetical protein [Rhodoferax sp.]